MTGLEEKYLQVNGLRLHVMEAGPRDGQLIILLHGFPEFWRGWHHQIAELAAQGYRVVVPDQRGYNLSEKPRGVAAYGIDHLADDVIGLIDAYGYSKARIAGHDWGAAVAWWVAARNPDRVEKLAILNVPHPVVMQKQLSKSLRQLFRSWYMFAFQLPGIPERLIAAANFKVGTDSLLKSSRPGTFSAEDLELYRQAWAKPGALTGMINWYRALFRTRPGRLKSVRIRVPTLVIWGTADKFLGRELAPLSIELCDQGRLEFLEGASHWVAHEEPARVNQLLADHFR